MVNRIVPAADLKTRTFEVELTIAEPKGLKPGMVVTMEPGLYFRADALERVPRTPEYEKFIAAVRPAFERYKNIGVRIEDDVLVTGGKPQVISAAIPSRLVEVEAAIARLHKALKSSPLP